MNIVSSLSVAKRQFDAGLKFLVCALIAGLILSGCASGQQNNTDSRWSSSWTRKMPELSRVNQEQHEPDAENGTSQQDSIDSEWPAGWVSKSPPQKPEQKYPEWPKDW